MKFQPKRLTCYSELDLIQEIRRVVQECGGVVPNGRQFARVARVWLTTITKKFGSYEQAIRKAGFAYEPKVRSRNKVITVKKQPRIVHVQKVSAYAQRLKAFANLTETDLFNEIDRIWKIKERRPTYWEFRRESQFGISIYESRFGGWLKTVEAFCKARGVRVQRKAGTWLTKELLLDELRAIQRKRSGDLLTWKFYKANGGTYSCGAFSNHFGNWPNAVKAVGGISGRQARYSKEELFDEIQRLWEKFGRQPTYNEMRGTEGKFNPSCYVKMFGSWTKAIYAFCEDRNSEAALIPLPFSESLSSVQIPKELEKKSSVVIPSAESAILIIVHKTSRQVPKRLRWRVFARDNFICQDCGRSPAKHGVALEADHKTAWTNGGETVFENLRTLCEDCNKGKSNL
jgi:hypothetical protein